MTVTRLNAFSSINSFSKQQLDKVGTILTLFRDEETDAWD